MVRRGRERWQNAKPTYHPSPAAIARTRRDKIHRSVPPLEVMNIPSQVHMVWIGPWKRLRLDGSSTWRAQLPVWVHKNMSEISEGFDARIASALETANHNIAVVRADFAKLLVLWKYGGIVTDFDTRLRVHPSGWESINECDIYFGLETTGPRGVARDCQILTWTMASRAHAPLLRAFIDRCCDILEDDAFVREAHVQDIAGSGVLTDFVEQQFELFNRTYKNEARRNRFMRLPNGLCIAPTGAFRGNYVIHDFEGSWKTHGVKVY